MEIPDDELETLTAWLSEIRADVERFYASKNEAVRKQLEQTPESPTPEVLLVPLNELGKELERHGEAAMYLFVLLHAPVASVLGGRRPDYETLRRLKTEALTIIATRGPIREPQRSAWLAALMDAS